MARDVACGFQTAEWWSGEFGWRVKRWSYPPEIAERLYRLLTSYSSGVVTLAGEPFSWLWHARLLGLQVPLDGNNGPPSRCADFCRSVSCMLLEVARSVLGSRNPVRDGSSSWEVE